jgi:DNA polymerase/3'-5' exonuclease PolX
LETAQEAVAYVRFGPAIERLDLAGSLRRCEVTVGDIDIVHLADAAGVVAPRHECAERCCRGAATKASIWLPGGLQIDLRCC